MTYMEAIAAKERLEELFDITPPNDPFGEINGPLDLIKILEKEPEDVRIAASVGTFIEMASFAMPSTKAVMEAARLDSDTVKNRVRIELWSSYTSGSDAGYYEKEVTEVIDTAYYR